MEKEQKFRGRVWGVWGVRGVRVGCAWGARLAARVRGERARQGLVAAERRGEAEGILQWRLGERVRDAPVERRLRIEALVEEDDALGLGGADEPREPRAAAGRRDEPQLGLGQPEARLGAHDAHVARERPLEAARHRGARLTPARFREHSADSPAGRLGSWRSTMSTSGSRISPPASEFSLGSVSRKTAKTGRLRPGEDSPAPRRPRPRRFRRDALGSRLLSALQQRLAPPRAPLIQEAQQAPRLPPLLAAVHLYYN